MYEAGPKNVLCPLICLPPVCGTADCFFYVVMKLAEKGYRVISVGPPLPNLGVLPTILLATPSIMHHNALRLSVGCCAVVCCS